MSKRRRSIYVDEPYTAFTNIMSDELEILRRGCWRLRLAPAGSHNAAVLAGTHRVITCCNVYKAQGRFYAAGSTVLTCWRCLACPGCIACSPAYSAATPRRSFYINHIYERCLLLQLSDVTLGKMVRAYRAYHAEPALDNISLAQELQLRQTLFGRCEVA